ncbi:hypothetical protein JX266_009275 [Neoarthrinium moseri]|nr:hypothetical protein JX266_009275 [Neoarthrinium moseri]
MAHNVSGTPQALSGVSSYFRLPSELRLQILESVIERPSDGVPIARPGFCVPKEVRNIFLVSRQMYAEAAPIYYRDVRVDLRGYGFWSPPQKCANQFFETALTAREYVRNAMVCINLVDCCNCETVAKLSLGLHQSRRRLQRLDVRIGPDYPYPPYGCNVHPPKQPAQQLNVGLASGATATGPICLTKDPFQNFLRFLQRPEFGTVSVWVHRFHLEFLCQFHASHSCGRECRGEWRGPGDWVKIDHEAMIETLMGLSSDEPTSRLEQAGQPGLTDLLMAGIEMGPNPLRTPSPSVLLSL